MGRKAWLLGAVLIALTAGAGGASTVRTLDFDTIHLDDTGTNTTTAERGVFGGGQLGGNLTNQYAPFYGVLLSGGGLDNGTITTPLALFDSSCNGSSNVIGGGGAETIAATGSSVLCEGGTGVAGDGLLNQDDPDLGSGYVELDGMAGFSSGGNMGGGDQLLSPSGPEGEGLILIANENQGGTLGSIDDDATPGNGAGGGDIIFDFVDELGVTFQSISFIDLDESAVSDGEIIFTFTDILGAQSQFTIADVAPAGGTTTIFNPNVTGDNSYRTFDFTGVTGVGGAGSFVEFQDLDGISQLEVRFDGISGAIALTAYDRFSIPVPATLPLMVTGLAAFGLIARRRRRHA